LATASVAALRRFIRPRHTEERCDTCGEALSPEHAHTFDPAARRIRCACDSCDVLYAGIYRHIPRQVRALPHFQISDAQWDELMIPISLAFFSFSSPAAKVIAQYPGPAGAAESLLPLDTWEEIAALNPELTEIQADVEALLVNRVGSAREYFSVPIDECYKLVGLIRLHWRGLSGGAMVWGEMAKFFDALRARGGACRA
jgi:hypothetical protein